MAKMRETSGPVNISESVQRVDGHDHLGKPQGRLFFLNGAKNLQELAQITA